MANKWNAMGAVFIGVFIIIVLAIPLISVGAPGVAVAGISPMTSFNSLK